MLSVSPSTKLGRSWRTSCLGAVALVLVVAPLVTACGSGGFQPMYAASYDGKSLSDSMRQVSVTTIPGRVGQRVRNELLFQTTGGGESAPKAYKLDIVLRERLTSQLVNAQGDAESQIFHLDADFQLTDTSGKDVILKGQSFGRAGFQRFQTIYANVRAKRDAENRAARTVAADIRSRIEAALSRRQQL
jgi:LPS-assembly lipoprotein